MGKLILRFGAMNSAKTANLIMANHNYIERGFKTLVLKPGDDTKAGEKLQSRAIKDELPVDEIINRNDSVIYKIIKKIQDVEAIFVDESQFLTANQVDELGYLAHKANIEVICYGLRSDFKSDSFPGSKRLLEIADKLEEVPTVCLCGKKARLNARIHDGKFTIEGEQIVIDGEGDDYISLCGDCYYEYVLAPKMAEYYTVLEELRIKREQYKKEHKEEVIKKLTVKKNNNA